MEIEAVDAIEVSELPVIDDTVIALDSAPADPDPADPAPVDPDSVDSGYSDVLPGAQSFGGPVEVPAVDPAMDSRDGKPADGEAPADWAYTDFIPVYDKDPASDGAAHDSADDSTDDSTDDPADDTTDGIPDGTIDSPDTLPPGIYTMTGGDPVVFATSDTPGRSLDPLPYERTTTASPEPAPVHEIDPDIAAIHYAAADTFTTGLDLL